MTVSIDDLRARPEFGGIVADRLWNAFWRKGGTTLGDVRLMVDETLESASDLRLCLVAHSAESFMGTCSLIENDLPARHDLTPWLAALWVEPDARGQGIATRLIDGIVAAARLRGQKILYLHARDAVRDFYHALGWQALDRDPSSPGTTIFSLALQDV